MTVEVRDDARVDEIETDADRVPGAASVLALYVTAAPGDELGQRRAEGSRRRLQGALWTASIVLVDHVFSDLAVLERADAVDVDDIDQFDQFDADVLWVLPELPPALVDQYDVRFTRRFLAAAIAVTGRLTAGWIPPVCVAEELAIRLLLNQVEVIVDLHELDIAPGWRGLLEGAFFEDLEHELLYNGPADDLPAPGVLGETGQSVDDWFIPFGEPAPTIPYLLDR